MPSLIQYGGQAVFFVVAAALTGYFSADPHYKQVPKNMAQVKFSFAYGARRTKECRKLSSKEIAALPPGERRPNTCERERQPVHVQLVIDGEVLYEADLQPTGLSSDGPARTYQKFMVPAGVHTIVARMRDSVRSEGYDYVAEHTATLAPWQNLAVDFKADAGGFIFR
ncbi:MAG: hypothetical protein HKN05_05350 [Rhizobiales bacterium]|nr:hypothetical protein [Hyphomicrobiales bacterium]